MPVPDLDPARDADPPRRQPPAWRVTVVAMVAAVVAVALFYVEWYWILTAAVFLGGSWAVTEEFVPEDNWLFNGPYSRWFIAALPVPVLYLGLSSFRGCSWVSAQVSRV